MKVERFTLGGVDHTGAEAERLFLIAQGHGFSRVGADVNPWPCREDAHRQRFVVDVDVSGVSAAAVLSFENAEELMGYMLSAPLTEPDTERATACYRRLAGYAE